MSDVPIRDYVDVRLEGLHELVITRADANQQAVIAAREALDKRLDAMNEFRSALNDVATRAATRDQLEAVRNSYDLALDGVRDKINDVRVQVAVAAALVSLIVSYLMHVLTK